MDPAQAIDSVERAQDLIQRGPIAFVAAFFAVAFLATFVLLLRSKDRHMLAQHALQKEHAEEVAKLHKEAREFAGKFEVAMHGFLDLTDDIRFLAFEGRQRRSQQNRDTKKVKAPVEGEK